METTISGLGLGFWYWWAWGLGSRVVIVGIIVIITVSITNMVLLKGFFGLRGIRRNFWTRS